MYNDQKDASTSPPVMEGEKNHSSSLTESEVIEIRKRYKDEDVTLEDLAEKYDISRRNVGNIVNGDRWPNTDGPIQGEDYDKKNLYNGEKNPSSKLTEKSVIEMRKRYRDQNISQYDLAEKYCISQQQVGNIVNGNRWKNSPGPIKGMDY